VGGGLELSELEDVPILTVRILILAKLQVELGEVESGRDVAWSELQGALVRLPLPFELPGNLVDEPEVIRPAKVTRLEPRCVGK
jgi:hypothetical protein